MRQSNKSLGMKISAFVLAFAMVLTLVGTANVSALAADDDSTASTFSVYCAYNPNDGDHLFTTSYAEYNNVVTAGWIGQDEAFKVPGTSSTPAYRIYNPNSGEHFYVTAKAEADNAIAAGWNDEGIGFYTVDDASEGKPVYRVFNPNATGPGSHYFTQSEGEKTSLVNQGWRDENIGFYAVADATSVVSLVDQNGLQSDGTAIEGDTLAIVFGSGFGVPQSVAWYKDGAVVLTRNANLAATTSGALMIETSHDTAYSAGTYYAQVENTKGEVYKTNEIVVVEDAANKEISGFNLADPYDALAAYSSLVTEETDEKKQLAAATNMKGWINIATTSQFIVVDATVDKVYGTDKQGGYFTLVELGKDKNTVISSKSMSAMNATNVSASKFTNAKLFENAKSASGYVACTNSAIKYTDNSGKTHVKFLSGFGGESITRGERYVLAYSDSALTDSDVTPDKLASLDVTSDVVAPYVMAPTGIQVTGRATSTQDSGWGAKLTMNGIDASWITDFANTTAAVSYSGITVGNTKIAHYSNTTVSNVDGTQFALEKAVGGSPILGGQTMEAVDDGITGTTGSSVYVTYTAPKGIFGEDKVELVSDPVDTAIAPVEIITISEDLTSNPANAIVTFDKMQAAGTLNLYKNADSGSSIWSASNKVDSVHVGKNAPSATFEDVFSNDDINKYYAVEYVPDDEETFASVKQSDTGSTGVGKPLQLNSLVVSYKVAANSTIKSDAAAKVEYEEVNQFGVGNSKVTTDGPFAKAQTMSYVQVGDGANTQSAVLFTMTSGSIKVTNNAGKFSQKNLQDYYTWNIGKNKTLKLTVSSVDSDGVPTFKVEII